MYIGALTTPCISSIEAIRIKIMVQEEPNPSLPLLVRECMRFKEALLFHGVVGEMMQHAV